MLLAPCHAAGTRVLHLSHTTLIAEALCGTMVDNDGEPDTPVVCDDCLEQSLARGLDLSLWVRIASRPQELRLAA